MAKGEIARFEQFYLLSLCFQKAVCCRGVSKRLYEGKGLTIIFSQMFFKADDTKAIEAGKGCNIKY